MPLPLTVSCFSKIQIGFTFLVPAHLGSPGKGPLNGCVCVCVHWLLIRQRVKFKVACLVRQSLSGQAPLYLADDCRLVSDSTRRSLRSADVSTCMLPRTLSSYGNRTIAAAGPRQWNSRPVQLRNPDITYGLFPRQLKGHLFREARTQHSVTSDMRCHRKTLNTT